MLNMILALLEDKKIITDKEGTLLAEKIGTSMLPSDYREAKRLLKKILAKL